MFTTITYHRLLGMPRSLVDRCPSVIIAAKSKDTMHKPPITFPVISNSQASTLNHSQKMLSGGRWLHATLGGAKSRRTLPHLELDHLPSKLTGQTHTALTFCPRATMPSLLPNPTGKTFQIIDVSMPESGTRVTSSPKSSASEGMTPVLGQLEAVDSMDWKELVAVPLQLSAARAAALGVREGSKQHVSWSVGATPRSI